MYKEEEIQEIISKVIEISLEHEGIVKKMTKQKDGDHAHDVPEYNPVYKRSVELRDEIAPHMELGVFPEKLFRSKAPNEHPDEYAYRKAQFQPVTIPFVDSAFCTINRIWNDSNYSVTNWTELSGIDDENQPQNYFEKKYPLYNSIYSYFRSIATRTKFKDANGVRVVKPRTLPMKDDADGNLIADQSKLLDPISVIYECDQVIKFEDGEYAVIELREKSLVRVGNSDKYEGRVFEFYDDQNIWKITQVGKKIDYEFTFDVYYEHNLGKLPATKLKGRPCQKETDILYESHLMPAIPNLNIALYNSNTLEMSITNDAFPQRWEYVDPCNYEGCDAGLILGGDGKKHQCPNCKGTGHQNKHSPLGVFQLKTPTRFEPDALNNVATPPFGYSAPDTSTLEFRHAKYIKDIEQAFAFLNIDVSNSNVNGSGDTALGKKIDREELFSFLLLVSHELFDLLEDTIDLIGTMRYGTRFEKPTITRPINFSIRSDEEITEELIKAKEANIPSVVLRKLINEQINKRFNTDKSVTDIYNLISGVDRLMTLSNEDVIAKKTINAVQDWEVILHDSIDTFIYQVLIEDPKFLDKEFKDKKKILEKMAKDMAKGMSKLASTDNILAQANGIPIETPVDIEAEAKANLKGSVGGVQGILAIQMQVSQGVTDYEAAVVLLFEIYGFDDVTARKMLGPKEKLLKANANIKGDNREEEPTA